LLTIVRRVARAKDPTVTLKLTADELRRRYTEHETKPSETRGLLEFLLGIAGDDDIGPIRGSKSEDCAPEMFRIIRRDVERLGWDGSEKRRPITAVVSRIAQWMF
jgi:hypothetical protein